MGTVFAIGDCSWIYYCSSHSNWLPHFLGTLN